MSGTWICIRWMRSASIFLYQNWNRPQTLLFLSIRVSTGFFMGRYGSRLLCFCYNTSVQAEQKGSLQFFLFNQVTPSRPIATHTQCITTDINYKIIYSNHWSSYIWIFTARFELYFNIPQKTWVAIMIEHGSSRLATFSFLKHQIPSILWRLWLLIYNSAIE